MPSSYAIVGPYNCPISSCTGQEVARACFAAAALVMVVVASFAWDGLVNPAGCFGTLGEALGPYGVIGLFSAAGILMGIALALRNTKEPKSHPIAPPPKSKCR